MTITILGVPIYIILDQLKVGIKPTYIEHERKKNFVLTKLDDLEDVNPLIIDHEDLALNQKLSGLRKLKHPSI